MTVLLFYLFSCSHTDLCKHLGNVIHINTYGFTLIHRSTGGSYAPRNPAASAKARKRTASESADTMQVEKP